MGKVIGMAQGRNLEEEKTQSEFAFISSFSFFTFADGDWREPAFIFLEQDPCFPPFLSPHTIL